MKVFISGSISIKKLPKYAIEKIDSIISKKFTQCLKALPSGQGSSSEATPSEQTAVQPCRKIAMANQRGATKNFFRKLFVKILSACRDATVELARRWHCRLNGHLAMQHYWADGGGDELDSISSCGRKTMQSPYGGNQSRAF